ncbi:LLM class flavin-dependent oxidoreductase [Actinomycetospora termitidis]|uniref:LLM class flavin-dependent oxidoreductase n=1 Tax=Actinomycetospora termitidis TaxID=3053470 RepID=A0ABT7M3D0_9PSEU|nr:LLM class flavin-dependent oxidoreductase [Actinomycetospora sp. Odt1-22]MDL5155165.1 LLM class flavin-dependent oxidoreductase [Actinomycetospora sp. Odt1-22]
MKVGLRIPPCAPVPDLVAFAREAEAAGLDQLWFPDSQLLWRDVFTVCSAVAGATERVGLGTAVTNVATRHPSVVASAARTVAEVADGRFTLGVGVGNSSVGPVGMAPSTGRALREGLATVRALLSGDEVEFGPVRSRLRDPIDVPLHLAASGPRNLRLAGEVADGAILLSGVAPGPLAFATARVAEGAEAAGRAPVPITVSAFCRVTDDVERDARELKPVCVEIARNGGGAALAAAGVEVTPPATVEGVYPDLVHAEDWDAAVRFCDPYVDDASVVRFAREFCLVGTAKEIEVRVAELAAVGVDGVFLQHVGSYDLPTRLLADLSDDLLARLRP